MALDGFCDYAQLPKNQCAHCRELDQRRDLETAMAATGGGGADETMALFRVIGHEALQERWFALWMIAFGPEEDWEAMAEIAAKTFGLGPWFLAEYDSRCKGCGEPVYLGDSVRYSDDEGGIVCLDCGTMGE